MAQDLPNGFTGFSQRRPNGFVSASAAMGTPRYVGEQPPAGNAANKGAYEAATAAFSSGAEGAFQYAVSYTHLDVYKRQAMQAGIAQCWQPSDTW